MKGRERKGDEEKEKKRKEKRCRSESKPLSLPAPTNRRKAEDGLNKLRPPQPPPERKDQKRLASLSPRSCEKEKDHKDCLELAHRSRTFQRRNEAVKQRFEMAIDGKERDRWVEVGSDPRFVERGNEGGLFRRGWFEREETRRRERK